MSQMKNSLNALRVLSYIAQPIDQIQQNTVRLVSISYSYFGTLVSYS